MPFSGFYVVTVPLCPTLQAFIPICISHWLGMLLILGAQGLKTLADKLEWLSKHAYTEVEPGRLTYIALPQVAW